MLAIVASIAMQGAPNALELSRPSLRSSVARYEPRRPFLVGLHFRMKPGWHIYWKNPGDSGQEVRVRWSLPKGWRASQILWPLPQVLTDTGLTMYVYPGEATLLVELTPGTDRVPANVEAHLEWLVCKEICLPAKADLKLRLSGSESEKPSIYAPALKKVFRDLPERQPRLVASATIEGKRIALDAVAPPGLATRFSFLPADTGIVQNLDHAEFEKTGDGVRLLLPKSEYFRKDASRLRGILVGEDAGSGKRVFARPIDVQLEKAPGGKP